MIKKLLVDRFVFTPPLLALFFYVIALLEVWRERRIAFIYSFLSVQGRGTTESKRILSEHLWPTLKLSWKIYTVVQFVNLYYVPQQVEFTYFISLIFDRFLYSFGCFSLICLDFCGLCISRLLASNK